MRWSSRHGFAPHPQPATPCARILNSFVGRGGPIHEYWGQYRCRYADSIPRHTELGCYISVVHEHRSLQYNMHLRATPRVGSFTSTQKTTNANPKALARRIPPTYCTFGLHQSSPTPPSQLPDFVENSYEKNETKVPACVRTRIKSAVRR